MTWSTIFLTACGAAAPDGADTSGAAEGPDYWAFSAEIAVAACAGCDPVGVADCETEVQAWWPSTCVEWSYTPTSGLSCLEAMPADACWESGAVDVPAECEEACGQP